MTIIGGTTREGLIYRTKLEFALVSPPSNYKFIAASGANWTSATSKADFIKAELSEQNGYSRYSLSVLESDLIYNSLQKRIELVEPKRWELLAQGLALQWNGFAVLVDAHNQANTLLEGVNFTTNTFTCTAHGLNNDDEIIITPELGSTLPTGITDNIYYVINSSPDAFQIATTQGGSVVNLSDSGSGDLRLRYANGLVIEAYYNDQEQTILEGQFHPFDWFLYRFNTVQATGNTW